MVGAFRNWTTNSARAPSRWCCFLDQVDLAASKTSLEPLGSLETEIKTAARVAKLVFDSELARADADMLAFIRQYVYSPEYQKFA